MNKYSQNYESETKSEIQSKENLEIGLEAFIDKAKEASNNAKDHSTSGIDLINRGSLDKAKAEKLLFGARDFAIQGEIFKEKATEAYNEHKTFDSLGNTKKVEYERLDQEAKAIHDRYVQVKNAAALKLEESSKAFEQADFKHKEALDLETKGQFLVEKASLILGEASNLNESADKLISEGNTLLDKAKAQASSHLKELTTLKRDSFNLTDLLASPNSRKY